MQGSLSTTWKGQGSSPYCLTWPWTVHVPCNYVVSVCWLHFVGQNPETNSIFVTFAIRQQLLRFHQLNACTLITRCNSTRRISWFVRYHMTNPSFNTNNWRLGHIVSTSKPVCSNLIQCVPISTHYCGTSGTLSLNMHIMLRTLKFRADSASPEKSNKTVTVLKI
jgi:hypothetical protein